MKRKSDFYDSFILPNNLTHLDFSIIKVFCELLIKKPIEQITVKELCSKSFISRGTFYNYFSSVYDVQETLINFIIENIMYQQKGFLYSTIKPDIIHNANPLMINSFNFVKHTQLEHRALWGDYGPNLFKQKATDLIKGNIYGKILYDGKIDCDHLYVANFITNGFIACQNQWINDGCNKSTEDIVLLISKLCFGNFY